MLVLANSTGNATLTSGSLTAGAATNFTLSAGSSGASIVLGQGSTGNVTLTPAGTVGSGTEGYVHLGSGPSSDGYFQPLKWSAGNGYWLTGGFSTFQSVADNLGAFTYNARGVAGDVQFSTAFESRFQNAPQGVDTEYYYAWNGPIGVTPESGGRSSRRIFQMNTSWGTNYSAPSTRKMGYSDVGWDVNKFYVDNGANYGGQFLLDFTTSPIAMTWQGSITTSNGINVGGAITQSNSSANTLTGTLTITAGNGKYTFNSGTDCLLDIAQSSADTGIRLRRNGLSGNEYINIGAAAGGAIFGGLSNSYCIDVVGNPNIRQLVFRYSSNGGSSYSTGVTFDHSNARLTVGYTTQATSFSDGSIYTAGGLSVAKASFLGGNVTIDNSSSTGETIFISPTTIASNPAIWFKQSSPSSSNYALQGTSTTTHLNAASGGTLRLRIANGNYVTLNASSFTVDNVPVSVTVSTASTSTSTGALVVSGGVGVAGATYIGGAFNVTSNSTSNFAGSLFQQRSVNNAVQHLVQNTDSSGTSAIAIATVSNGAYQVGLEMPGQSYTTAGPRIANRGYIYSDGAAGTTLHSINGSLRFWTGNTGTERATIDTSGVFSILTSTASTSTTSGALVVSGGVGVAGAINAGSTTEATTSGAGSLTTAGGIYSAKAIVANRWETITGTLTYSATPSVDFTATGLRTISLTGNAAFAASSNIASGRSQVIRIICDASTRTLSFPAGWKFLGASAPTSIASGKTAVLSLTAFGATDSDVIASYSVQV